MCFTFRVENFKSKSLKYIIYYRISTKFSTIFLLFSLLSHMAKRMANIFLAAFALFCQAQLSHANLACQRYRFWASLFAPS